MRQPSKAELIQENQRLKEALTRHDLFISDLLAGRATMQIRGGVQWIISRPGSPSGGLALTRSLKYESWALMSLDDAILMSHDSVFQGSYDDPDDWTRNYEIGIEAQMIQNEAIDASIADNKPEHRIGLAGVKSLRNFKPVKVV